MVYRNDPKACPDCYDKNREIEKLTEKVTRLEKDAARELRPAALVRIYLLAATIFGIYAAVLAVTADLAEAAIKTQVRSPWSGYLEGILVALTIVGTIGGFIYTAVTAVRIAKHNHHF